MPKFFVDFKSIRGGKIFINNDDVAHIVKVLRHSPGDKIVICDAEGTDYDCIIESVSKNQVVCEVLNSKKNESEPDVKVSLFIALPKSDKMDFVIQKAVELGVYEIIPYQCSRCVVKADKGAVLKKTAKWQKTAREAAKQCKRGRVPKVLECVSYKEALEMSKKTRMALILYEKENGNKIDEYIVKGIESAAVFIGPEGGFDEKEIILAYENGAHPITLGNRILRLETAALCALSLIMYITRNL